MFSNESIFEGFKKHFTLFYDFSRKYIFAFSLNSNCKLYIDWSILPRNTNREKKIENEQGKRKTPLTQKQKSRILGDRANLENFTK